MNLRKLMEIAAEAYEPTVDIKGVPQRKTVDLLDYVCADGRPRVGLEDRPYDTLSMFVVYELAETFDANATDQAQLERASKAMSDAKEQLENVECGFEIVLSQMRIKEMDDATKKKP